VGVRVAGRDVVAAEAPERRRVLLRDGEAPVDGKLAETDEVVAPRTAPDPVEERLQPELRRLLGEEAGPVVQAAVDLEPRSGERTVRLLAPAPELLVVEGPVRSQAVNPPSTRSSWPVT
jgi:hypothetical protein